MKTKKIFLAVLAVIVLIQAPSALALTQLIPQPADLPPGAMNFDSPSNLTADPNIVAAIIGVLGLLVGSAITIFATLLMRHMDIRREDQHERAMIEQNKREKEYQIKQEIYRNFLHELAHLETFNFKNPEDFKKEWTKTEVKVDLVASNKVRQTKEQVQNELLNIAEKNIKAGTSTLSTNYLKYRDALLDAIREDIDIFQHQ